MLNSRVPTRYIYKDHQCRCTQEFIHKVVVAHQSHNRYIPPDEYEIEFRIVNGVDYNTFHTVRHAIDNNQINCHESISTIMIYENNVRKVEFISPNQYTYFEQKNVLDIFDLKILPDAPHVLRCSFAHEKTIPFEDDINLTTPQCVRFKKTYHYYIETQRNSLRLDLSEIKYSNSNTLFYEIELENIGLSNSCTIHIMYEVFMKIWTH